MTENEKMASNTTIASHETFVGMLVTWMHVPRGGYGYAMPVDAQIVSLNPMGDRAIIAVKTRAGRTVHRTVSVEHLRRAKGAR